MSAWEIAKPIDWAAMNKKIRHRDSVEAKLLSFFDANPGEELFVTDACAKFNCTNITYMRQLLKSMFDRSLISREWVGDCYVYRAAEMVREAA